VSSADGWLVEDESPKQAPGLCREKPRPQTGEGRAYTQNPAAAQASHPGRGLWLSTWLGWLRNSEPECERLERRLTGPGSSCSGVLA